MISNKNNPNVELVYTSLAGTKIYGFKDLSVISAFRGVSAEKAKRFASLSITKDELGKLLDKAIHGVNEKQDLVQAMAILHELKWRNNVICEENSLLELAYIYLMLEGEDDEKPSPEWNKKKSELVKTEVDLRGFFLRVALQLAGNFSQKPDADLLSYLEETKEIVQNRIHRFLD